ncbi:alpha/beta hydrolase [Escherichia coli]
MGRYVIRYDHRDTGKSTSYEPGQAPYSVEELADDVVRVIDGYGLEAAHLVGMSLGGISFPACSSQVSETCEELDADCFRTACRCRSGYARF